LGFSNQFKDTRLLLRKRAKLHLPGVHARRRLQRVLPDRSLDRRRPQGVLLAC
jgi:hypothetical protein